MNVFSSLGYTHCFFVSGGNVMHLLDSASRYMECVPFSHEHSAVIAAEYFNQINREAESRAFALVTAGPGLTNSVSAITGAWLDSREVVVVGGQVKTTDLKRTRVRQLGIQEIDGAELVRSVTKAAVRIEEPLDEHSLRDLLRLSSRPRKGPVFLEFCLDTQAREVDFHEVSRIEPPEDYEIPCQVSESKLAKLAGLLAQSNRPVLLLGGGLSQRDVRRVLPSIESLRIPTMTTWNGADLVPADSPVYMGRPNTWGQRSANIIMQQADLLLAFGTRLGLQQIGFAWESFVPGGRIIQVDIDPLELEKGRPKIELAIQGDALQVLDKSIAIAQESDLDWGPWLIKAQEITSLLAGFQENELPPDWFLSPHEFISDLSELFSPDDVVIPCSSGGAFTVSMQRLKLRGNQRVITNKGLASMGYGLAGAVGASIASKSRVTLIEGDGGFLQNAQELATLKELGSNVKVFLFANDGYASIRMTQKNYFHGNILGTGAESGLRMPNWKRFAASFELDFMRLGQGWNSSPDFLTAYESHDPWIFEVPIDPNQTYFPKISSRVLPNGSMESNPIHMMDLPLPDALASVSMPHIGQRVK